MEVNLTFKETLDIYHKSRNVSNLKPSLPEFRSAFHSKLSEIGILREDELDQFDSEIKRIQRKIERYLIKKGQSKVANEDSLEEVCFSYKCSAPINVSQSVEENKRKRLSLEHLTSARQKRRRLDPLVEIIKQTAEDEQTTPAYLLGRALQQIYYKTDKRIAGIAKLLMDESPVTKLSPESASNLKNYNNIGREGYQRVVRALHSSDIDVFPSWKSLRSFEKSLTPTIHPINDGLGVEFSYEDALTKTTERILESLNKLPEENTLTLHVKDGLDGSGSHSIFNQNGKFI